MAKLNAASAAAVIDLRLRTTSKASLTSAGELEKWLETKERKTSNLYLLFLIDCSRSFSELKAKLRRINRSSILIAWCIFLNADWGRLSAAKSNPKL